VSRPDRLPSPPPCPGRRADLAALSRSSIREVCLFKTLAVKFGTVPAETAPFQLCFKLRAAPPDAIAGKSSVPDDSSPAAHKELTSLRACRSCATRLPLLDRALGRAYALLSFTLPSHAHNPDSFPTPMLFFSRPERPMPPSAVPLFHVSGRIDYLASSVMTSCLPSSIACTLPAS
jgi:hypothetical protein